MVGGERGGDSKQVTVKCRQSSINLAGREKKAQRFINAVGEEGGWWWWAIIASGFATPSICICTLGKQTSKWANCQPDKIPTRANGDGRDSTAFVAPLPDKDLGLL